MFVERVWWDGDSELNFEYALIKQKGSLGSSLFSFTFPLLYIYSHPCGTYLILDFFLGIVYFESWLPNWSYDNIISDSFKFWKIKDIFRVYKLSFISYALFIYRIFCASNSRVMDFRSTSSSSSHYHPVFSTIVGILFGQCDVL